jgi:hypothetical protein
MVFLFARHDVKIGDTVRVYRAAGVTACVYVDGSDFSNWIVQDMDKRGWEYVGEVVWDGRWEGYCFGLGKWERARD